MAPRGKSKQTITPPASWSQVPGFRAALVRTSTKGSEALFWRSWGGTLDTERTRSVNPGLPTGAVRVTRPSLSSIFVNARAAQYRASSLAFNQIVRSPKRAFKARMTCLQRSNPRLVPLL